MMRFSVCIETVFRKLPLERRITESARCGAAAIEFWGWKDKDLDAITHAKEAAGVDVAAFGALNDNAPNDPATRDSALSEILLSIETARQIGATNLIVTPGTELPGVPRTAQLDSIAQLLADTAPAAAKSHVSLLFEPLNARIDHPGTLVSTIADARTLVDQVNQPNVMLLFDIYHQYITEGSVLHLIESNIGRVGHFHVADVPGRGQPGTGALDFAEIFKLIETLGYDNYVGLEFYPSGDPAEAVKKTLQLA